MKTEIDRSANRSDKFLALVEQGIESWVEAGKIVTEELERNPAWADEVNARYPEISVDTIYAFDRIGQMKLHPKLLFNDGPGVRRLRRMSYELQEKYLTDPVPLLIKKENGWETLRTSVFNLTPTQALQVFGDRQLRTEPQQRAWIEDRRSREMVINDDPYRVTGRKLIVMEPCQFSAKQLAQILAQME